MANSWEYAILLDAAATWDRGMVDRVLGTGALLGFRHRMPADVVTLGGDGAYFDDRGLMLDIATAHGLLIPLFNEATDEHMHVLFDPHRREIAIGIVGDLAKGHDERIASELLDYFESLCEQLRPRYGWSIDEVSRASVDWDEHLHAVRSGEGPTVLCWLNYFDQAYYAAIERTLHSEECARRVVGGGYIVQCATAPWNGEVQSIG